MTFLLLLLSSVKSRINESRAKFALWSRANPAFTCRAESALRRPECKNRFLASMQKLLVGQNAKIAFRWPGALA